MITPITRLGVVSIYSWWGEQKPANTIIQIQVTEVFINLDMKRFAASASLGTCPSAMESRVAMAAVPAVNKRWWNAVDETWSQQPIVVWDSWGWSVSAALPISQWSCPWGSHMRMFAGLKSVLWPFSAQVLFDPVAWCAWQTDVSILFSSDPTLSLVLKNHLQPLKA